MLFFTDRELEGFSVHRYLKQNLKKKHNTVKKKERPGLKILDNIMWNSIVP